MALNIRNNHTIELLCKMGPSTSEYSGWIHIKRNKVHMHSISVELRSGMVLHKQLMEGMTLNQISIQILSGFDRINNCLGTLGWIRLPVLGEEKFTLHYSNPDDFQQSRSAGDLRPIEINSNQSPAEFCVYGFEAGSFRRHIRLCDIHGDVIEDILLLLDIDPVRISRSFDITLGGIPSTRKIEVANPYSEEKTFYLHTRNVFNRTEFNVDGPLAE